MCRNIRAHVCGWRHLAHSYFAPQSATTDTKQSRWNLMTIFAFCGSARRSSKTEVRIRVPHKATNMTESIAVACAIDHVTALGSAILNDTGQRLDLVLLEQVLDTAWLLRHGSPYPSDKVSAAQLTNKQARFLSYRWLSYWTLGKNRVEGVGQKTGVLKLGACRAVLDQVWPDH